ncbi:MAG: rhodanese-like domain-containing protein [Acidobacteriota bacterium]|nr:rhodanese-like domain-containing protein [Acidobacteriota bacterium]
MAEILELTPHELQARLSEGDHVVLIDVREPEEVAISQLQGSVLIPMQSVPGEFQRIEALGDESDLAVLCHHGVRSLNVVAWLRQRGIENCFSVAGGIDRWSIEIDPAIPRY